MLKNIKIQFNIVTNNLVFDSYRIYITYKTMITKYYYKSIDFNWGNYGTDLGYVMTRHFLTQYERNKGLVINVQLDLDSDRKVVKAHIKIIDSEHKFIEETLNKVLELRLNQIFKDKISVNDLSYTISEDEQFGNLIKELDLSKCFGKKYE